MEAIYTGCLESYKNYLFDNEILRKMALKCAKYLYWKRANVDLPYDSLFRFNTKLAEDIPQ